MAIKKLQRKTGEVYYSVYVQCWNVHGKRIQKRLQGFKSLRQAQEAENRLRAEFLVEKGKPRRLTWSMWLSRHLEYMRIVNRPSTVSNYESALSKWVTPHFENRFLDEITPLEIHDIVVTKPTSLSENTKRTLLDQVRRVFGAAVENGVIAKNPTLSIKIKVPEIKQSVLNATEAQKLLLEAKLLEHRFYPIWATALFTGMRSGELFALKWNDIDLENKRIYVTKAWSNKSGFGPTKSQRNRVIPVSDELMGLLVELKLKKGTKEPEEDFVLPHLQEWIDGSQADVLRKFCKAIGITSVKFHDLRATFITQLLLKGVPLAQVMSIVGHTQLHTTNRYLRVAGADLEGANNKLSYSLPKEVLANVIAFNSVKRE